MKIELLCLVLSLAGCASHPPQVTYRCGDGTGFIARGGGDAITVLFEDRKVELPRVHSGSGEKYTDRELLFWNKGNEAILASGHRMVRCLPTK